MRSTCKDCKFCVPSRDAANAGWCHLGPPHTTRSGKIAYPKIRTEQDWCSNLIHRHEQEPF